jgi:hypothetical protein
MSFGENEGYVRFSDEFRNVIIERQMKNFFEQVCP